MRQRVTQLQLCLYLSVEHLRSGRLRERGPAGRLTVAEAKCDNGLGQACGYRPGKGEQREKRHSLCVNSPRCSVSTTLSLTPTPKHTLIASKLSSHTSANTSAMKGPLGSVVTASCSRDILNPSRVALLRREQVLERCCWRHASSLLL